MKPIEPAALEAPATATTFTHALFGALPAANDISAEFSAAEFAAGFDDLVHHRARLSPPPRFDLRDLLAGNFDDKNEFAVAIAAQLRVLDASPTGRALALALAEKDLVIGGDGFLGGGHSYYYTVAHRLDLSLHAPALAESEKGAARLLSGLVCGLRRAWHELQQAAPAQCLRARDYADHFRLLNADVEAMLYLTAWELRGAGNTSLWRALLAGDNADIACVFERAISDDPQSQFNGEALKAAFNQWFACRERINRCDHAALEQLDAALIRTQGTPERATFATEALRRENLQALGRMPAGANYLEGCLFTNPWYAGFDDETNLQHLRMVEEETSHLSVFKR